MNEIDDLAKVKVIANKLQAVLSRSDLQSIGSLHAWEMPDSSKAFMQLANTGFFSTTQPTKKLLQLMIVCYEWREYYLPQSTARDIEGEE